MSNHTTLHPTRSAGGGRFSRRMRWLALSGVFLLALALRLIHLDEPPRDFWTVRQYYVPMLAQAMYWEGLPDLPEWQQELGQAHKQAFQGREPPVMEWMAQPVYRAMGRFAIWPLRLHPVLAWLAGGLFLFGIVRRTVSPRAALLASMLFLLLPYGVTASRSLQPDSMMVMGLLAAVWTMLRHYERPTWGRWAVCTAVSGMAIWIKPGISQFAISLAYLTLALERQGGRGLIRDPKTYLFYVGAATPAGIYLAVAILGGGGPAGHFGWNFQPQLIPTIYFWKGWLGILVRMFGIPALILAGFGLFCRPSRRAAAVMLGLGFGYVAQCFFTIAATPTHDYWHLQVVPLVAMAAGLTLDRLLGLAGRGPHAMGKLAVVWGLAVIWLATSVQTIWADAFKPNNTTYFQIAREIGTTVGHSTRTIILDHDKGYPLMYLADIYGTGWPVTVAMQFGEIAGTASVREHIGLHAAERFDRFYAQKGYEYFIVCRTLDELDRQPGLRDFLQGYPLVASGYRYLIYDLRERPPE